MENKPISERVVERLLIAKNFLDSIRFSTAPHPDRFTLAKYILTAHDAAELAIAGIAAHLGCLDQRDKNKAYLMDYFSKIKAKSGKNVDGKDLCHQLNIVRNNLKHEGLWPDNSWYRIGQNIYDYISKWCTEYLREEFETLNEDVLITDVGVKDHLKKAREAFDLGRWKEVLEQLAFALETSFQNNRALRNLRVGVPHAEDAIKLSTFGIQANDFLTLQEFLPEIFGFNQPMQVKWKQEKFGHPANWNEDTASFCLKTFVTVALRIQDAAWIPGAIDFNFVYEYKITALEDNVEIIRSFNSEAKEVVCVLKKDEFICGIRSIDMHKENLITLLSELKNDKKLRFLMPPPKGKLFGESTEVDSEKVRITCVPMRASKLVREYYPDIEEVDYIPS